MSDFDDDKGRDSGRSRTWIVAAGVVVLIVAMGIFVSIAALTDDEPAADPAPSPEPTTATTTPVDDANASVCGLEGHEEEGSLTAPPSGVTWSLAGKVAVPFSKTAGPGVVEDSGVRYCYAHTPEGALLAAANAYGWEPGFENDPVAVVEHGVASGPGYDAAIAVAEDGGPAKAPEDLLAQIRGFRLLAYDGETALVDIALQTNGGVYGHQRIELAWELGDWRIRLTPDGSAPNAQPLPDLTGFVPWAGA